MGFSKRLHSKTQHTLPHIQQLVPEGFKHTTVDMCINFCRRVEDVEKNYIEKDGIVENTLEKMVITIGEEESDDEGDDDDELIDDTDKQLIDRALWEQSTTSASTSDICTDSRQELNSDFLSSFDPIFLQNVLPLTD